MESDADDDSDQGEEEMDDLVNAHNYNEIERQTLEEERRRMQYRQQAHEQRDPRFKKKLKGMDPINDGDIRKKKKARKRDDSDDEFGHSDDESSEEEEEADQSLFTRLTGFFFFGCAGTSKR